MNIVLSVNEAKVGDKATINLHINPIGGKEGFTTILYKKLESFLHDHSKHPISGAILNELAVYQHLFTKKELQIFMQL